MRNERERTRELIRVKKEIKEELEKKINELQEKIIDIDVEIGECEGYLAELNYIDGEIEWFTLQAKNKGGVIMKFKTTKKAVKEGYRNIIEVSYCGLQHLLYYKDPVAYTCGVYGWNADIYEIGRGSAICTGYRPFGDIRPDYELIREYDNKARDLIALSKEFDFAELKEMLDKLLDEFIEKVLGE